MYRNVLVPIDLSDKHSWQGADRDRALPDVSVPARGQGGGAGVRPADGRPVLPDGFEDKLRQQAARQLKALVAEQVPEEVPTRRIVAEGKIYREILNAAKAAQADLIVMGSHHPELKDYLLGPNADKVVRHADCSVMVVRE